MRQIGQILLGVSIGIISMGSLSSCKNLNQSRVGSYFEEEDPLESGSGKIRAVVGQLDFEWPASSSAAANSSAVNVGSSKPNATSGSVLQLETEKMAADQKGADQGAAISGKSATTLRMQFSIVFDVPPATLNEIASDKQRLKRVASLNTFNVIHEPSTARKEVEQIGRALYHSVSAECVDSCFRLVTGEGKLTDRKDIFIIELQESGGNWIIKWFNYFGAEVKNFGMPVQLIQLDKFDGNGSRL